MTKTPVVHRPRRIALGLAALALSVSACGTTPAPGSSTDAASGLSPTNTPTSTDAGTAPVGLDPDGGLKCPPSIPSADGRYVPAKPSTPGGGERLLPDRKADSMVVCSYPVMDLQKQLTAPFGLTKRTVLDAGQRSAMSSLLSWAPKGDGSPKPCTMMAGNETVQLVGTRFGNEVVWVSAKNDANTCIDATNGEFISNESLGARVSQIATQSAKNPPRMLACDIRSGRWGDHLSLVPDGDPKVIVCRQETTGAWQMTNLSADQSASVVSSLRHLPTSASRRVSSCVEGAEKSDFRLALVYSDGPAITVEVSPDCVGTATGLTLQSADGAGVKALASLIQKWSPAIAGPDKDGTSATTVPRTSSDLQTLSPRRPDAIGGDLGTAPPK